jgi:hypothetical protein
MHIRWVEGKAIFPLLHMLEIGDCMVYERDREQVDHGQT